MTRTTLAGLEWPLRTARLSIRPATPEDAAATFAIRTRADVARWLGSRPLDAQAYAARFGEPAMLASTLVGELDGRVVLDLMVSVEDAWAQAEVREQAAGMQADLAWVLDPAYAGRGLATEAVRALLGICFDGLGLHRVTAICFAENEPSWRLMERVGMRREAVLRQDSLHADGTWRDSFQYALLDEEWAERRTGRHWDAVFGTKPADETSWYRPDAGRSARLAADALARTGASPGAAVDIGCGTSTVVDELLDAGWSHVTALDVSREALATVGARLARRPGGRGGVELVASDVLSWRPTASYDLWHDRAALHFLTDPKDVAAYVDLATVAVRRGGALVLGTFGPRGPEQCSGLPVRRYAAGELADLFGGSFDLVAEESETHRTPWGAEQEFTWVTFVRR